MGQLNLQLGDLFFEVMNDASRLLEPMDRVKSDTSRACGGACTAGWILEVTLDTGDEREPAQGLDGG